MDIGISKEGAQQQVRAAVCAAALAMLAGCGTGADPPSVTQSPSYWHWLDEHSPREDTAHYLTYEEQQPHEEE